jgi:hypothetical protein
MMESRAINLTTLESSPLVIVDCSSVRPSDQQFVDFLFLILVARQPSAVASLVQTKSRRASPDCDIWDELSGRVDALLIHSQCAV